MSVKGVFACVGRCVGTDMCPCACVCTHVCEGFDNVCGTVCPHQCVYGCSVCVRMCVQGVLAVGACVRTCVRTAMYVHVGSGFVQGWNRVYVKEVCADVALRRSVCVPTAIWVAAVCAHGSVRPKRKGDAMMGRSLN
jgi:hypothetical protein